MPRLAIRELRSVDAVCQKQTWITTGSRLRLLCDKYVPEACPRVLVIEDEILIRLILCECLREEGYHVIEAGNADEALDMLEITLPDLIISDVRMPGSLDGIELLALIKSSHPNIPVIITSGHFSAKCAIAAGADDFVSKPYSFEPVLKIVHDQLSKAH